MTDDLVIPSSRRALAAKQRQLTERAARLGVDLAPVLSGQQPQQPPAGPQSSMAGTPLAAALSDLADAKRAVQAAGGDEAAIVRAVAQRIREKVSALPDEAMTPVSNDEIDGLVDSTIQQVLTKQKKRITSNAAAALRCSSVNAAVKLLVADNQRRASRLRNPRNIKADNCRTTLDWEEFFVRTLEAARRRPLT